MTSVNAGNRDQMYIFRDRYFRELTDEVRMTGRKESSRAMVKQHLQSDSSKTGLLDRKYYTIAEV